MQIQLGELLHNLRLEQNLEAKQVYAGICSKSNMFYYENNQRTLDNLIFERLVERMGVSPEEFSFMISEAEYAYRQWQEKVYEAIENKQFPPIPMTPVTVAKTINKVISEHEPTDEELQIFASQRELSPEEQKFVAEYSKED